MIYKNYSHFKYILLNIFGLIYSAENVVMAYIVGTLTNMAINKQYDTVFIVFGKICLILLVVLLSNIIFNYLKADAIMNTNKQLRTKILKGMLSDNEQNSSNLGFLTNDFKLLETNRYESEIQILVNIYTLVLALTYAVYLNWFLTLIFLAGSILPTIISNYFQEPIKRVSKKWAIDNDKYVNNIKYILSGTEIFNLYDKQDNAVKQNKVTVNKLETSLAKMNVKKNNVNAYLNIIAILGTFLLPFSVGVILVIKGYSTLGSLFAIVQLANSFTNPILQILSERNNLATTKNIADKVTKFIIKGKSHEEGTIDQFNELKVNKIELFRQNKKLSQNINLDIKKGEKVAVIGKSGAGKSTLLQFLMYGKYGSAMDAYLNGSSVKLGSFKNLFSYAGQQTLVFPDTLLFNLTLGTKISEDKIMEVCKELKLDSLVQEKGLLYNLGENANQLSGGQIARIGLARALLLKRPIVLLDEVNASLDKETSDAIHHYLLNSDLTILEVIHHYTDKMLGEYDNVIDLNSFSKK